MQCITLPHELDMKVTAKGYLAFNVVQIRDFLFSFWVNSVLLRLTLHQMYY